MDGIMGKKIKKISSFMLLAVMLAIPVTASAGSYTYSSPVMWHSVAFDGGSYFNVTASNPSLSSANQSLYKGGSLGVKYSLVNSSGNTVKSMSKYGAHKNKYWYFGNMTSGKYKLIATNLYDDDNTGVTLSGQFNY